MLQEGRLWEDEVHSRSVQGDLVQESADEISRLLECASVADQRKLLADLFTCHRDRLRRTLLVRLDRRLMSRVDPSDVLQEAYLEASRRLADYLHDLPIPLFLWLRRITVQKLFEIHRFHIGAQKRDARQEISMNRSLGPPTESATLADGLIGQGPSPSQMAARAEVKSQLEEALDKMGTIDREIVSLRHFEQLSSAEAAEVLSIGETAARKRYIRAMNKLKEIIRTTPGDLEGA